jgi:hypothetical protein
MFVTRGHLPHQGARPRRATALAASALTGATYPKPKSPPNRNRRDSGFHRPCPGPTGSNLSKMNTYAKCAANPRGMNTCKIIGLKVSCNEYLQKNGGREGLIVTQRLPPARRRRQASNARIPIACALSCENFHYFSAEPKQTLRRRLPGLRIGKSSNRSLTTTRQYLVGGLCAHHAHSTRINEPLRGEA